MFKKLEYRLYKYLQCRDFYELPDSRYYALQHGMYMWLRRRAWTRNPYSWSPSQEYRSRLSELKTKGMRAKDYEASGKRKWLRN